MINTNRTAIYCRLSKDDEQILKRLGIDVTSDPVYPSENLYYM